MALTPATDWPQAIAQSVAHLKATVGRVDVAVVLGSGLGGFADQLPASQAMAYTEIPGFPEPPSKQGAPVQGHSGRLLVADTRTSAGSAQRVACLQGRFHYYEGYTLPQVVHPVRVMRQLGAHTLIVTNAAGGLNPAFRSGDLMLITDHLNLMGNHPLRGPNDEVLGPRFPDMTHAYDPALLTLARSAARTQTVALREGIYAAVCGPTYETPAEVRMLQTLGADAVGMSTVPEVIAARHMGMRVLGISCITNAAAGLSTQALSHDEVLATGQQASDRFSTLLTQIIATLD